MNDFTITYIITFSMENIDKFASNSSKDLKLQIRLKNLIFYYVLIFSSDLITSDPWTAVLNPIIVSGLCRYEVVHTNTSSVGTNTICFMIW